MIERVNSLLSYKHNPDVIELRRIIAKKCNTKQQISILILFKSNYQFVIYYIDPSVPSIYTEVESNKKFKNTG